MSDFWEQSKNNIPGLRKRLHDLGVELPPRDAFKSLDQEVTYLWDILPEFEEEGKEIYHLDNSWPF